MATMFDYSPSNKRPHESNNSDFEEEDEINDETPEEKRLRLATIYLEELQRKGDIELKYNINEF
jgi:hypothetical protein